MSYLAKAPKNPVKQSLLCFVAFLIIHASAVAEKIPVIIDADTANEVDDVYALARAIVDPRLDILALNSTQWQASHWAVENTQEQSHRVNRRLMALYDRKDIPLPRGSRDRLHDWGQDVAQHSAAAYNIIETSKDFSPENKLNVLALGALTNVASALLIAPEIAPNIRLYYLGMRYDFEKEIWHKTTFNCIMDPHALNVALDAAELEMIVVPNNVAIQLQINYHVVRDSFSGTDAGKFIYERWKHHLDGSYPNRTIWDLGPLQAMTDPDTVEMIEVQTPPDNTSRMITVVRDLDGAAIIDDFVEVVSEF